MFYWEQKILILLPVLAGGTDDKKVSWRQFDQVLLEHYKVPLLQEKLNFSLKLVCEITVRMQVSWWSYDTLQESETQVGISKHSLKRTKSRMRLWFIVNVPSIYTTSKNAGAQKKYSVLLPGPDLIIISRNASFVSVNIKDAKIMQLSIISIRVVSSINLFHCSHSQK